MHFPFRISALSGHTVTDTPSGSYRTRGHRLPRYSRARPRLGLRTVVTPRIAQFCSTQSVRSSQDWCAFLAQLGTLDRNPKKSLHAKGNSPRCQSPWGCWCENTATWIVPCCRAPARFRVRNPCKGSHEPRLSSHQERTLSHILGIRPEPHFAVQIDTPSAARKSPSVMAFRESALRLH